MTRQMISAVVSEISDEYVAEAAEYAAISRVPRRLQRWLTVAASIVLAFGLGIFSAWFFTPSDMWGANDYSLKLTSVRVDDKMASYAFVDMSPYEEAMIESWRGELYRQHGGVNFYRVKGADDLYRLIFEDDEGLRLIEFYSWMQPISAEMWQTSLWYTSGHFTDEDIAALDANAQITYGDTLRIIYGVESAEDIKSVKFRDADVDKTDVGDSVKIKTVVLRDGESAERIYALLCDMTENDAWQGWVRIFASDEQYKNGILPLAEQTERDVLVTLNDGKILEFNYSPQSSCIKTRHGDFCALLPDAANDWLISAAEIDMQYHYYGDDSHYGGETATPNVTHDAFPE